MNIERRILKQELQKAVVGGWLTMAQACRVLRQSKGWAGAGRVLAATPSDKVRERFGK